MNFVPYLCNFVQVGKECLHELYRVLRGVGGDILELGAHGNLLVFALLLHDLGEHCLVVDQVLLGILHEKVGQISGGDERAFAELEGGNAHKHSVLFHQRHDG